MKERLKKIKQWWSRTLPFWKSIKNIWKKFQKTRGYSLVKILFLIAVCIGIGSGAAYIHHESDPTEDAAQYFRAFIQQDYDTIMKLVDVPEGGYIDRKQLETILSEQKKELHVDRYEILDPKREDGRTVVVFRCFDEETGKKTDFKVYLNRFHHGLNPISDYKISMDDFLVENYTVTIPKDTTLVINDTKLHNLKAQSEENGGKTYAFSAVLQGSYQVCAENTYGIGVKKEEITKPDFHTDLSKTSYEARPEYFKMIEEKTNGMLQQYYTAVRQKKISGKELEQYFSKEMTGKLKGLVQKSVNMIFDQDEEKQYEITGLDLSDQKITATYNKEKNCFDVQCGFRLKYECATQTSLLNSYSESYKGNCQTAIHMKMNLPEDNMQITEFTIKNKKE